MGGKGSVHWLYLHSPLLINEGGFSVTVSLSGESELKPQRVI